MIELFKALKNKFAEEEIKGRRGLMHMERNLKTLKKNNGDPEKIKRLEDTIYWTKVYGEEEGSW